MENKLNFIKYRTELKHHFINLNLNWLKEYFIVEPYDREVLEQCEEKIITPGGCIFFAVLNNEIIGAFAYMKMDEGVFELTKMTLKKSYRGKGFGNQIMAFSIQFAKQHHWKKLVLYSSRKLKNALHLYRKFGYVEVTLETNAPYLRGDIKMELFLQS